jgi:hypothetical protein
MRIPIKKNSIYIIGIVVLVSCKNSNNHAINIDTTAKSIRLTDSSRAGLTRILDTVVKSNSNPDDITIKARFVNQGKNKNGDSYITLMVNADSLIVLTNPMPFREGEIAKFIKVGNNITVTYSVSDKKVKLLAAHFEP